MRSSPATNICTAVTGSRCHCAANCWAETPATLAKASNLSPPDLTAEFMEIMARDIADPPSSAWMPTEAIALASDSTPASDAPATFPAPDSRCASARISDSVEAPALPRATRVAAKLSTSSPLVPITLAICAMLVAASSAVRLVVSPRSIMTRVKPRMSACLTPS